MMSCVAGLLWKVETAWHGNCSDCPGAQDNFRQHLFGKPLDNADKCRFWGTALFSLAFAHQSEAKAANTFFGKWLIRHAACVCMRRSPCVALCQGHWAPDPRVLVSSRSVGCRVVNWRAPVPDPPPQQKNWGADPRAALAGPPRSRP